MKILNPNNIQNCKDSKSSSLFVYEFEIMNACGLTVSNSSGPNSENDFDCNITKPLLITALFAQN